MTNPTGSWSINNKTVESLYIGNKEIETIERVSDGAIIYQRIPPYNLTLVSNKATAETGETVTFTATLTSNNQAVSGETITFTDGTNTLGTSTTNASGVATLTYSWNTGNNLNIKAIFGSSESNVISVTITNPLKLTFVGSEFTTSTSSKGLIGSNMVVNWGDGTSEVLSSNTRFPNHTYSKNETYTIKITGEITGIDSFCFSRCVIIDIVLPNTLTTMKNGCFNSCTSLTSVRIPNSITNMTATFSNCNIVDYQLYWNDPPTQWGSSLMPNRTNTYYTIPHGTTANYIAKSFPSDKLIERNP